MGFGIFLGTSLPSKPPIAKLIVEVVSVLLVVMGIMGELGVGIKIASINGALRGKSAELRSKNAELRSKSDELLALVTQQAGDAATSAKIAHQEADAVKGIADEARADAKGARKETAVLAQAALPRKLSEEQKVELVELLSATPTFSVVFVNTRSLSNEVLDFTDDFMEVFKRMKLIPPDSSSRKLSRAIAAPEGQA